MRRPVPRRITINDLNETDLAVYVAARLGALERRVDVVDRSRGATITYWFMGDKNVTSIIKRFFSWRLLNIRAGYPGVALGRHILWPRDTP